MNRVFSQFTSGSVGKNLQEGLGTLANKAQGLAQGLAHGIPKNVAAGATGESVRGQGAPFSSAPPVEPQLQLQEPYSADEETTLLRQQVVQLQVKNGMLQAELEEARGFSEEAAHLRAKISDMEVKMLFLLKGADGVLPMLPKVLEVQQKRIDDLTNTLAERNGQLTGLRSDNVRLRCQVEDLMAKMASSARHAETTHNEQMAQLKAQLAAAQGEAQQLRTITGKRSDSNSGKEGNGGDETAALREQLQQAHNVIKEFQEANKLKIAADVSRTSTSRSGATGNAEALEWRIAELEEQLEEANDKLRDAECRIGAAGDANVAALEAEVQKLRGEVESERNKVADVAAAAAAEATIQAEAELEKLRKRMAEMEKEELGLVAARDAAEKRVAELHAQVVTLQSEHDRALEDAAAAAAAAAVAAAEAALASTTAASEAASRAAEASAAELQTQLDMVSAHAMGREREVEATMHQCTTLQQQLLDAMAKAAAAEEAVRKECATATAARDAATEARRCADSLRAELEEAKCEIQAADVRYSELSTDYVINKKKLDAYTARIVIMTERVAEGEEAISAFRLKEASFVEANEANVQLKRELALAQAEVSAARNEAEWNQEQAQLANENVAKLRAILDRMKERKVGLEEQVQELQDKLSALGAELASSKSAGVAFQEADSCQAAKAGPVTGAELTQTVSGTPVSCQTDEPLGSHVSTDTAGLRVEMPHASTDTEGLPGPIMPSTSTDTTDLPSQPAQPAGDAVGPGVGQSVAEAATVTAAAPTAQTKPGASREPKGWVAATELAQWKRRGLDVLTMLEEKLDVIEVQQAKLEQQMKGAGVEVRVSGEAATLLKAGAQADSWENEDWDAWDGNDVSPRPSTQTVNASAAAAAIAADSMNGDIKDVAGSGGSSEQDRCGTVAGPLAAAASGQASTAAEMYVAELALLQGTIQQLLGCWSRSAAEAPAAPDIRSVGPAVDGGGVAQEAAVLGATVVTLLGQLQAHFQEAAAMRHQLEQAVAELRRLRAISVGGARYTSGGGATDDGDEGRGGAELEEMAHMMQDIVAAEQRALAAEAALAAAASLRQQLEQQLLNSDEAAAAAEANARQLACELAQAREAAEQAADVGAEMERCRAELADVQAALAAALDAGAAKVASVERALAEAQAEADAANARAVDALAAATAAEVLLKEQEGRLAEAEQGLSVSAAEKGPLAVNPREVAAAPAHISAEHFDLMQQIAATAQTLAPLFKNSHDHAGEISQKVSELEALVARLDLTAATAAAAATGTAPPSYEQSFQSKHIGPAAATLLAAEAAAGVTAAGDENSMTTGGLSGAGHVTPNPADLPRALLRNLSGSRRASDDACVRARLEAVEAAARTAESELRVQVNLAESLRAELREQQAAMETLRAATVTKEAVLAMEASYKEQIEQLQGYLTKATDKQARRIAAFEEEHSQALAAAQAQGATALAAAAKEAAERAAELEAQLEAARSAVGAAEERAAAAEVAAEEAKRLAQDVERGWGERLERLQKINKKRASELDNARAESSGLNEQLAVMGEQVIALQASLAEAQRELELERGAAAELRARLASLHEAGDNMRLEVAELRTRAAAAEALAADLEQRASTAESKLLASEADRSKLADQLVSLHSLREERAAALAQLAAAQDALAGADTLRVRCGAAEAAQQRAEQELTRVTAMMSNLEARLQQVEDENEELVAELDEERRRGAALARTWAGELEALPSLPRDRWPAAVRRLVDGLEGCAAHGPESSGRVSEAGHAHITEDVAAAELEALREAARAAAERTARVEAEAAAANVALDALRRQMDETRARAAAEAHAEAARRLEELDVLRAQLSERGDALAQELHATQGQLQDAETGMQRLQEEIERLRDKSRGLLEEKESEVDTLRTQLRQARAVASGGVMQAAGDGETGLHQQQQQSGTAGLLTTSLGAAAFQAQNSADAAALQALHSRVAVLEQELEEYKHAYEDAESTHQLRDTAQAALREELLRLRAQLDLSNHDVQYLRAAIISFFESGSLPRDGLVLQVLSRLLRFTPAEMAAIAAADHAHKGGRRGPGVGGSAPVTLVGAPHSTLTTAGQGSSSSMSYFASVTSRVASAVSGLTHAAHAAGSGVPQPSFGQRPN
ncbi:hypothetical protein VaNZ11_014552 [Volvox africanus]|uniref:GRIP domain-containing protein n=1 Tax=Volvox africanus TaxID=51714 RepID=A0ABQ5SJU3_9CHLO|nr:hypothetical protein VaNZ11_014552 [Volvox africanus]